MARKKTSQLNPSLLRLGVVIPLHRIVSYRILHWDDVVVVVVWLLPSSLLIALTIAQCATSNEWWFTSPPCPNNNNNSNNIRANFCSTWCDINLEIAYHLVVVVSLQFILAACRWYWAIRSKQSTLTRLQLVLHQPFRSTDRHSTFPTRPSTSHLLCLSAIRSLITLLLLLLRPLRRHRLLHPFIADSPCSHPTGKKENKTILAHFHNLTLASIRWTGSFPWP